jgi:hypothetical protein
MTKCSKQEQRKVVRAGEGSRDPGSQVRERMGKRIQVVSAGKELFFWI